MVNEQQARAAISGWEQAVNAAFRQQQAELAAAGAPAEGPGVLENIGTGIASFGQALLNRPELVAEVAGGVGLTVLGGTVATGGGALSLTGGGAVVGVPASVTGGAMVGTGIGMVLHGAHGLVEESQMNPAEPIQFDSWFGKSREEKAEETRQEIEEHQRRSEEAAEELMKNLNGKLPKAPSPWRIGG